MSLRLGLIFAMGVASAANLARFQMTATGCGPIEMMGGVYVLTALYVFIGGDVCTTRGAHLLTGVLIAWVGLAVPATALRSVDAVRTSATTSCPFSSANAVKSLPVAPVAPRTASFIEMECAKPRWTRRGPTVCRRIAGLQAIAGLWSRSPTARAKHAGFRSSSAIYPAPRHSTATCAVRAARG